MTQSWHDLLFAHWPVAIDELSKIIPNSFEVDLFEGEAWVGIVAFHMTNVTARGMPTLPWVSAFPELNMRTYVRVADKPGVFFLSLDAGSRPAVVAARTLLNLPYYFASMSVEFYALDRSGHPYRLDIHHSPWRLQPAEAELNRNTMAAASSIRLSRVAPLLHFAGRQDAVAWAPTPLAF